MKFPRYLFKQMKSLVSERTSNFKIIFFKSCLRSPKQWRSQKFGLGGAIRNFWLKRTLNSKFLLSKGQTLVISSAMQSRLGGCKCPIAPPLSTLLVQNLPKFYQSVHGTLFWGRCWPFFRIEQKSLSLLCHMKE